MSDLNRYVSPYFNRSTVINQDISQVLILILLLYVFCASLYSCATVSRHLLYMILYMIV